MMTNIYVVFPAMIFMSYVHRVTKKNSLVCGDRSKRSFHFRVCKQCFMRMTYIFLKYSIRHLGMSSEMYHGGNSSDFFF